MRNKTIVTAALFVFLLSAPLLAQVTPAQRAEIEKTLTEASKELTVSINELKTDVWAKYASEDFQEWVSGGNMRTQGKEAFMKSLTNLLSQRTSQKFDMDSLKVYVISQDSAYVVGTGGGYMTLKSGRHGGWGSATTFIWKKEPGGWKIIHFHESSW